MKTLLKMKNGFQQGLFGFAFRTRVVKVGIGCQVIGFVMERERLAELKHELSILSQFFNLCV